MVPLFRKNPWNQCELRHPLRFLRVLMGRNLDSKTKAWPSGLRIWLRSLRFFRNGQTPPASRFGENINDINARSAIHPQLGQKGAGKRRRASRQRTPVKGLAERGGK
jgi:hypothetical protein